MSTNRFCGSSIWAKRIPRFTILFAFAASATLISPVAASADCNKGSTQRVERLDREIRLAESATGSAPKHGLGDRSRAESDFKQCLSLRSDKTDKTRLADAARYCIRAADGGLPRANAIVEFLYAVGDGVPKSADRAVAYWKRGAALNDPSSTRMLAGLHENGQWIKKDVGLAVQLYRRAATLGDPIAQERLRSLGQD